MLSVSTKTEAECAGSAARRFILRRFREVDKLEARAAAAAVEGEALKEVVGRCIAEQVSTGIGYSNQAQDEDEARAGGCAWQAVSRAGRAQVLKEQVAAAAPRLCAELTGRFREEARQFQDEEVRLAHEVVAAGRRFFDLLEELDQVAQRHEQHALRWAIDVAGMAADGSEPPVFEERLSVVRNRAIVNAHILKNTEARVAGERPPAPLDLGDLLTAQGMKEVTRRGALGENEDETGDGELR